MKRRICAAESENPGFEDALKGLEDDFDYFMSGIEKLSRSGANALNAAKMIVESFNSQLQDAINEVADAVIE